MQGALINLILVASDVVVNLNPVHRSSGYSGYADTLLTHEGLPLVIPQFRVWQPIIDLSEERDIKIYES